MAAGADDPVDHYILALSWSPTYCAGRAPSDAPLQCALDADRTFIVHGLWPNTRRDAPEFCRTRERRPSRRLINSMLDIMPSRGLIGYQWKKHGTCSGLRPDAYFDLMRRAAAKVQIPAGLQMINQPLSVRPAVLREAFLRANPAMDESDFYVRCRGDDLIDVRICLSPALGFVACPNVRARRCRSRLLEIDPPR
ncbi:ribonuclease T [Acuticoccus sp. MNP-M23]|uniref:ribonuclease T2 family protein n=1 Tax=Acuticoccus sp. MNP-M23 TaxID=3072793 RepID=UPI00281606AB|nr:ribonuclease T [Acuticoccus sp. MNP-M23]WMS41609.1 ribonuclease T [Acuticoccus sp. MNP-M23]